MTDLAAEVAFYAILSLLPAMISFTAFLSVLGSLVGGDLAERAEEAVLDWLNRVLTAEADGTVDAIADVFANQRPGLLTISLILTIWALSRGFAALVRALDVVYNIDEHRSWLSVRLTAIALAFGSSITASLMVTVLVVGPLLGSGEDLADTIGLGPTFVFLWDVLRLPAAFGVLTLWAAAVFHVAPDQKSPWRADLPGAVVTAVLCVLFTAGLRLYLGSPATASVYGALGGVLIVLIWLWLLALAIMIGAQVNALGRTRPRSAGVERRSEPADEGTGVDSGSTVEEDAHDGRGHDHAI